MSLVHRLFNNFFRARRWCIGTWESERGEWWDAAIKGSSALRAVVLRSVGSELAVLAGASVMAGFIDIEKLYDSIDPFLCSLHSLPG